MKQTNPRHGALTRRHAILALAATPGMVPTPAWAWNMPGHMVSGAFAYQELAKEDPELVGYIVGLLRQHPDYDTRWAPQLAALKGGTSTQQDEFLFMLAARWPDDARDDPEDNKPLWHYVSFPYGPGPQPKLDQPLNKKPDNLLTAYRYARDRVASLAQTSEDRAEALCWLMHLTGDAHQPLHAVSRYSPAFPKGDRGGTLQYIRASSDSQPLSLHKFWDGLITGSSRFTSVRRTAIVLRDRYPRATLPEVTDAEPLNWALNESLELAKTKAYLNGALKAAKEEDGAPVLPSGYGADSKVVAERRLALAGYRLVDQLKSLREALKATPKE